MQIWLKISRFVVVAIKNKNCDNHHFYYQYFIPRQIQVIETKTRFMCRILVAPNKMNQKRLHTYLNAFLMQVRFIRRIIVAFNASDYSLMRIAPSLLIMAHRHAVKIFQDSDNWVIFARHMHKFTQQRKERFEAICQPPYAMKRMRGVLSEASFFVYNL